MSNGNCVVGGRPHAAADGILLCEHHYQEMGRMLRSIEDEAVELDTRPSMAIVYDHSGGGLASQQSPIRLAPAVLADPRRGTGMTLASECDEVAWDDTPSALETLHSRARTVREERDIIVPTVTVILDRAARQPGCHGPVCDRWCGHESCGPWITDTVLAPATLTGERDLLSRQLSWIARQPWVDEMYDELRDLLAALRRANDTLITPVGTCDTLQADGFLCDGRVWHVLIKPDGSIEKNHQARPNPEDEPGFRCGRCHRVWTGTEAVRKRYDMWLDEQERTAAG